MSEVLTIEIKEGSTPPDLSGPARPPQIPDGAWRQQFSYPSLSTVPQPLLAKAAAITSGVAPQLSVSAAGGFLPLPPRLPAPPSLIAPAPVPISAPPSAPALAAQSVAPPVTPPPVQAPSSALPPHFDVRLMEFSGQAHRELSGAVMSGFLAAKGSFQIPPAVAPTAPTAPTLRVPKAAARSGIAAIAGAGARTIAAAMGPGDSGQIFGAVQGVSSALAAVPGPVGMFASAITVATGAVHGLIDGVKGYADKLSPFSAQLSVAQAQAEMRSTLGDLRRGQQMGPDLAKFVEQQSKLDQSWEDVKMAFMKKVVPVLTKILEFLTTLLGAHQAAQDNLNKIAETQTQEWRDRWDKLADSINWIGAITGSIAPKIPLIEKNTRKDAENMDSFLAVLANLRAPLVPVTQPGNIDPALNMPAIGGF